MDSPNDPQTPQNEYDKNAIKKPKSAQPSREGKLRKVEILVWLVIASFAVPHNALQRWVQKPTSLIELFNINPAEYLFGICILGFPFLFDLIFQRFPIEAIRVTWSQRFRPFTTVAVVHEVNRQIENDKDVASNVGSIRVLALLTKLADSSGRIAEKIYTRAGVYLLIGVMIAFSGLAFFYQQNGADQNLMEDVIAKSTSSENTAKENIASLSKSSTGIAVHMLSRFGVLFFIELVAFFFLKQYRSAMDEYRYFEGIKRKREENLVVSTLFLHASGEQVDFFKFVENALCTRT